MEWFRCSVCTSKTFKIQVRVYFLKKKREVFPAERTLNKMLRKKEICKFNIILNAVFMKLIQS